MKSMTGYGRSQITEGNFDITIEIRSVNHRYSELTVKIPRLYAYLEEKIKQVVSRNISRGKTEVSVLIGHIKGQDTEIRLNTEVVNDYLEALRNGNEIFKVPDDLSLSSILRLPDVFTVFKIPDNEEEIWEIISKSLDGALTQFNSARSFEGEQLLKDVSGKLDNFLLMLEMVAEIAPNSEKAYFNRISEKLRELMIDVSNVNESRILTEAAIFADKVAIDEEIVRLHSHIQQFRGQLSLDVPVGRKLDFIVQEMNREVNTIGSKAQDIAITRIVVEMKSEIEKIREQIQNIE